MLKYDLKLFQELKAKSAKPKSADFKELQRKVLRVIHENENVLCLRTESTKFSSFSAGLADKFWERIRSEYPEIDYSTE